MVEGKDLVLCPFVSQLYSSKYQDVKFILSKHLFRFEEVLGKRSEGESSNLDMVSTPVEIRGITGIQMNTRYTKCHLLRKETHGQRTS